MRTKIKIRDGDRVRVKVGVHEGKEGKVKSRLVRSAMGDIYEVQVDGVENPVVIRCTEFEKLGQ